MMLVAFVECGDDGTTATLESSSSSTGTTNDDADTVAMPTTVAPADSSSSTGTSVDPTLASTTDSTTSESSTAMSTESSSDDGSTTAIAEASSGSESSSSTDETTTTDPPPPDVPRDDACDVYAQDCPPGSKCMPFANDGAPFWNDTACFPIDRETDAIGESCTVLDNALSGLDSCELGAMCWNVDPFTGVGVCHALCSGSPFAPECADPVMGCAQFDPFVLPVCVPACDPLVQDCALGQTCLPLGDFVCLGDASGGAGVQGDPCEALNVCDPGLVCINGALVPDCATFGCCSAWCDLDDAESDAACAASAGEGAACSPFFPDDPPAGLENLGVCILE